MVNSNSLRKTTLGKAGGSAREYNLSRQMFSVSSSGTFVNREETSKERIIPLLCLYFLAQSAKLKESLTVYWLFYASYWTLPPRRATFFLTVNTTTKSMLLPWVHICMCDFEEKWLMNAKIGPLFWNRYVDDTFTMFHNKDSAN